MATTSVLPVGRRLRVKPLSTTLALIAFSLATRMVCFVAIWLIALYDHRSLDALFLRFDAGYYQSIALHGYPATLPMIAGHVQRSPIAFFPLFPMVVSALMRATTLPFVPAALFVNTVAAVAATWLISALVRQVQGDSNTAFVEASLWVIQPAAFVLTLIYAESLFTALAAGSLLALLRRQWLAAGVLSMLASATRPTGIVLVLCCLVVALPTVRRLGDLRPLIAPLLAPMGMIGYFLFLWARVGRFDAWFVTERQGWGVYIDGGADNLRRLVQFFHEGRADGLAVAAYVVVAAALLVKLYTERWPAVLSVYATALLLLALVARSDLSSVPRFLLPAFPLLLPLASRLARSSRLYVGVFLLVSGLAMSAAAAAIITGSPGYPP